MDPDPNGLQLLELDGETVLHDWHSDQLLSGRTVVVGPQQLGAVAVGLGTAPLEDKLSAMRNRGIVVAVATVLVGVILIVVLSRTITKPMQALVQATQGVAKGELLHKVPVRGGDELADLARAFNQMTTQLAATYGELEHTLAERVNQAKALQSALDNVRRSQEEQDRLEQTIRQISTPVVPVHKGVLVMPLVGMIDQSRAQHIVGSLLAAIETQRARVVILDITGVAVVDTAVAEVLLRAARSAQLLGAEPILVGITPQVAETIASLGLDLSDLVTKADLQSGLTYSLNRLSSPKPSDWTVPTEPESLV